MDDDGGVRAEAEDLDPGDGLLALYDRALPQVYGYLRRRCDSDQVAEDLTSETFFAAVAAVQDGRGDDVSTPWLIGVARHKLVDHWRRLAREERKLSAVASLDDDVADPWNARLDVLRARTTLARLGAHHRSALTLRYVDDLAVADVAEALGRTVHATEALLVRARNAFRTIYEREDGTDG